MHHLPIYEVVMSDFPIKMLILYYEFAISICPAMSFLPSWVIICGYPMCYDNVTYNLITMITLIHLAVWRSAVVALNCGKLNVKRMMY